MPNFEPSPGLLQLIRAEVVDPDARGVSFEVLVTEPDLWWRQACEWGVDLAQSRSTLQAAMQDANNFKVALVAAGLADRLISCSAVQRGPRPRTLRSPDEAPSWCGHVDFDQEPAD